MSRSCNQFNQNMPQNVLTIKVNQNVAQLTTKKNSKLIRLSVQLALSPTQKYKH